MNRIMGAGKKIALLVVLLAGIGYWLLEPVPDGYSASTSLQIRGLLAALKVSGLMGEVGTFLGLGSPVTIRRWIERMITFVDLNADKYAVQVENRVFDNVPVRIYRPTDQKGILPGMVYYHGGGWGVGSLDTYHDFMVLLSTRTKTVIVNVGYRLAPEFIFPIPFDDCVTATKQFFRHVDEYNVDASRIAVVGDSAGGNLAAAIALKLREEKFEPKIKMQVLIYPMLQAIDYQLPSMLQNADGPIVSRDVIAYFQCLYLSGNASLVSNFLRNNHIPPAVKKKMGDMYLNVKNLPSKYLVGYERLTSLSTGDDKIWKEIGKTLLNPYFSPLVARDVGNLPMSYVFTCEYDVLRDEGMLYAHRLKAAGNSVTHVHADIGVHGLLTHGMTWPETQVFIERMTRYIVENL